MVAYDFWSRLTPKQLDALRSLNKPINNQCPCTEGESLCGKADCAGCLVKASVPVYVDEDAKIAENMRDYWKHLWSGAER